MESIVVWLLLMATGVAQGHPSPSTAANEYFVGFFKNFRRQHSITLFIMTTETVPVSFTVSGSTGQIYSGTVSNSVARSVTLPDSFAVEDNTVRNKGVWIHATDASNNLTVHGMNTALGAADGFVALPCHSYPLENYTYYAVSTHFKRTSDRFRSQVLLVGCENDTELTLTPTQTIEIPSDLVRGGNSSVNVTSGTSYTVTLNNLQTFLFYSTLDLTGSKVVSNKPISFFSGHECADVPVGVAHCDHLVEQLPPTLTWGRQFFVASSFNRTTGEQYKLITSAATTTVSCYCYTSGGSVSETFITTLNGAGRSHEFHIAQNMFCSLQASNPILLVQFAIGGSRSLEYGDPFMMMIPPVEQYSNNYTFVTQSGFQNAITVTVKSEFFNSGNIILNGNSLSSATWTRIYCSTQTVCGYGTRVSLSVGRNFIYHDDPAAKLGTFVYGFVRVASYGYPAGMQLAPISVDCGHPIAPKNGSLESYIDTTEGSEVFYSCDPGLLPEGRMRTVCTGNGWSPNPADLRCTVATTTHVKPTMYHHTTTSTAFVETPLDSRVQPVATERATPSSTQSHLPLTIATTTHVKPTMYHHTTTSTTLVRTTLDSRVQPVATEHATPSSAESNLPLAIGLAVSGMAIVIITSFIIVLCIIMKRRQARNMTTLDTQREHIKIKEDVAHEYEIPSSMIKMTECEAYAYKP